MTRIELHFGREMSVTATGHATGSPTMCAAASCLMCTLEGWLANSEDVTITERRMEEGNTRIAWTGGTGSETAMEMMMVGFLRLQETGPDLIGVEITEENS